jgi:uncharacterized protein YndB with AHSA1/START domain
MKIDFPAAVGQITRKLDMVERGGREAWRLTAIRVYDTDLADAWDALTNPERIPRWFLPVSGELKLGGRYQLKGNAGGVIERCEPPRSLGLTWEMHGDVSWVSVALAEQGAGTRLTLEHVAHVPEALFDQFGPGGVGVGWDLALALGLTRHFETGAAVDAVEAEQWVASAEGRPFVEGCSRAWAEASIAAGTERGAAEQAAARVADFYSPPSTGG